MRNFFIIIVMASLLAIFGTISAEESEVPALADTVRDTATVADTTVPADTTRDNTTTDTTSSDTTAVTIDTTKDDFEERCPTPSGPFANTFLYTEGRGYTSYSLQFGGVGMSTTGFGLTLDSRIGQSSFVVLIGPVLNIPIGGGTSLDVGGLGGTSQAKLGQATFQQGAPAALFMALQKRDQSLEFRATISLGKFYGLRIDSDSLISIQGFGSIYDFSLTYKFGIFNTGIVGEGSLGVLTTDATGVYNSKIGVTAGLNITDYISIGGRVMSNQSTGETTVGLNIGINSLSAYR